MRSRAVEARDSFSAQLREDADPVWQAQHDHSGAAGRDRMRRAFVVCSEPELAFWDVGLAAEAESRAATSTSARRP
jgi:hypothetical protein